MRTNYSATASVYDKLASLKPGDVILVSALFPAVSSEQSWLIVSMVSHPGAHSVRISADLSVFGLVIGAFDIIAQTMNDGINYLVSINHV